LLTSPELLVETNERPSRCHHRDSARATEHRNVPMLKADPADRMPELCALQDPRMSTLLYAFSVLADEGVLVVRQERTAVVAGDPPGRGGRAGPTTASCPDAGRMHASR
jgi:hypothetical protein